MNVVCCRIWTIRQSLYDSFHHSQTSLKGEARVNGVGNPGQMFKTHRGHCFLANGCIIRILRKR